MPTAEKKIGVSVGSRWDGDEREREREIVLALVNVCALIKDQGYRSENANYIFG